MSDDVGSRLDVVADLRLDIDGVRAQVTADGDEIEVVTASPRRLFAGVYAASRSTPAGRVQAGQLADRLADSGLTVTVRGPAGPVLRVGRDARSTLAARLLGSSHVTVVAPRRLRVGLVAGGVALGAVLAVLIGRGARRRP